jgi:hypothetical protein
MNRKTTTLPTPAQLNEQKNQLLDAKLAEGQVDLLLGLVSAELKPGVHRAVVAIPNRLGKDDLRLLQHALSKSNWHVWQNRLWFLTGPKLVVIDADSPMYL